jgi:transcriptional regulator with XRE-family HTH domain
MHDRKKAALSDRRESFGARLKRERERRNISVAQIADSTKILGALLEGLERDDVSRWPVGFYRRAFLRAYATAIGLDPDETWREFAERFPEPDDSLPVAPPETDRKTRFRVSLSNRVSWFAGGPILDRLPPRCAAVAFDLAIIGAVAICGFVVFGGVSWPLAAAAILYYSGGILMLGNTPGVSLFAPQRAKVERIDEARQKIAQKTTFKAEPKREPGKGPQIT